MTQRTQTDDVFQLSPKNRNVCDVCVLLKLLDLRFMDSLLMAAFSGIFNVHFTLLCQVKHTAVAIKMPPNRIFSNETNKQNEKKLWHFIVRCVIQRRHRHSVIVAISLVERWRDDTWLWFTFVCRTIWTCARASTSMLSLARLSKSIKTSFMRWTYMARKLLVLCRAPEKEKERDYISIR